MLAAAGVQYRVGSGHPAGARGQPGLQCSSAVPRRASARGKAVPRASRYSRDPCREGEGQEGTRGSAATPPAAPRTCSPGPLSQQPGSRAQRRSGGTASAGAPSRHGCPKGCRFWNSSEPAGRGLS